jgi:hypothetical protein
MDLNTDLLQASNLAMSASKTALRNKLIKKFDEIVHKEMVKSVIDESLNFIKQKSLHSGSDMLIGNDYINSQIYSSDNLSGMNTEALQNNLSVIDMSTCLENIREYYKLNEQDLLTIAKSEIDPNVIGADDGNHTKFVDIHIYFPKDQQKMDLSVCSHIKIKVPIGNANINTTLYDQYRNQSIDIYDPDDPIFISRCVSYEKDGYDYTVNMRRKYLFPGAAISCSNNCTYRGIEDSYIICDCAGLSGDDYNPYTPEAINYVFESYDSVNIGIVKCAGKGFNVLFD